MKIAITSRAPFIAGAEIAGERLALGLQNHGHDVLLVVGTDGEAKNRFVSNGLRCVHIEQAYTGDGLGFRYRRQRNQLASLLKREKVDLVHSNDLPTHQMTSDAAKKLNIPRVCHHRWIFGLPAEIDWFNKFGCEQHVFVSEAAMNALVSNSTTLNLAPCNVLYDGLTLPRPPNEEDRLSAKRRVGVSTDKTTVLFAGQIVKRKGVADIIMAWTHLPHDSQSQAELIIIGDDLENQGAYLDEMKQLAAKNDVPAIFAGFQKNVPTWLTAADIVLVPSHVEPLGNATLEAMSYCRPVIGTKVGGIPEMIEDGKTGLLIESKSPSELCSAIKKLIQDNTQRETLGRAARARCEALFSLETHTQNALNIYESLLSQ